MKSAPAHPNGPSDLSLAQGEFVKLRDLLARPIQVTQSFLHELDIILVRGRAFRISRTIIRQLIWDPLAACCSTCGSKLGGL
jgi:hypothetical protein